MKPSVTLGRAAVVAAALAIAAAPSLASASATPWSVAHPPYTALDNVPYVPLNAITAISPSDVWAVGQDSGSPQINHWNGTSWSQSALPNGPCNGFENSCVLTGVSGDSASDVIAVGNGTINSMSAAGWVSGPLAFQWNGSGWQPMTVPSSISSGAMQHVQAFAPNDAWAVGTGSNGTSAIAAAEHWNGSAWTQVTTPVSVNAGLSINAISGSSGRDVWVVGQTQTGGYHNRKFTSVAMHYNGSAWSQVALPDSSGLADVATVSPTSAWALARDGSVLNWNGGSWTVSTQLPLGDTAIAALSPTDVWVAGVVSVTHYDGTSWTSTPVPSGVNGVTSHAVVSPGHIWFGGYYYPSNAVTAPAVLSTSSG